MIDNNNQGEDPDGRIKNQLLSVVHLGIRLEYGIISYWAYQFNMLERYLFATKVTD
jgi:hypothetical protein